MAYRRGSRGRSRTGRVSRGYSGKRSYGRGRSGKSTRRFGARQQTVRVVVETVPQGGAPVSPLMATATAEPRRKARF